MINNTITQNYATTTWGGSYGIGIFSAGASLYTGCNNIIYFNEAESNPDCSGTLDLNYSCSPQDIGGTGNITDDPSFLDPVNDDFNLQAGSPCIDAGDPTSPLDPDNTVADMGALYCDQGGGEPEIVLSTDNLTFDPTIVGENDRLSFTIYNRGDADLIIYSLNHTSWNIFTHDWNSNDSLVVSDDSLMVQVTFTPNDTLLFIDVLVIDNNDHQVSISLEGQGLPLAGIVEDGRGLSGEFTLLTACPNPFNPTTHLGFTLPQAARVVLSVYDVSGRRVATLVDGWRDAGYHDVTFDAGHLASGLYLARIQTGQYTAIQKMVLMK